MIYSVLLGLIGLILIYIEFFLPGGIMAMGGSALLLASLILFVWAQPGFLAIFIFLALLIGLVIFVCKLALKQIRKRKKSLYLEADQEGFRASHYEASLIGKRARCATDLKPSGHIFVEGKTYQALSEFDYIPSGTEVLISGGRGAYLLINRFKSEEK
jgi:membrane-bound ClpP family serine protease